MGRMASRVITGLRLRLRSMPAVAAVPSGNWRSTLKETSLFPIQIIIAFAKSTGDLELSRRSLETGSKVFPATEVQPNPLHLTNHLELRLIHWEIFTLQTRAITAYGK